MDDEVKQQIKERFRDLPEPVRRAITSSDVERHLRELAQAHKLHFDQWITLENEVMMALLGIQPVEQLGEHIAQEAGISREEGESIAADAFARIFEPIRQELERELAAGGDAPAASDGAPPQGPAPVAEGADEAAPAGPPHSFGSEPSTDRHEITGDPYREPLA
ncbi:MAG TPA: hypothetical protein VFL98_02735 [Candidatus Paceibacterota bacterium]|nr:hypothetical protein [Candidatus Paceibacterota bacterium]